MTIPLIEIIYGSGVVLVIIVLHAVFAFALGRGVE